MRAIRIKIHNFRSFAEAEILLNPYTLLTGANNSGKSNLIDAIRVFYEKDIKYEEGRDFPKFLTSDKEVWIEVEFKPSTQEFDSLKSEYQLPSGTFKVRKYLQSEEIDDEGKLKNGIYAYVSGELSNSKFYGAKNVQQGKFGEVIYIPAVSKIDEHTKLTGPSALRDLINIVLKKIMISSPSYGDLCIAFKEFGSKIKTEKSDDGFSLSTIEEEITRELSEWGTSFELMVNTITADEIIKSLIDHRLQDNALKQPFDSKSYGQGFQRRLIYTLIKLSAKYSTLTNKTSSKKDFSPQLTWVLFEEPEAFLHPSQIGVLDRSLREMSETDGMQVLISTHHPEFVSLNIEDIPSLIRICKDSTNSRISQITAPNLKTVFEFNQQEVEEWRTNGVKDICDDDLKIEMESIKYALWLDPRRSCLFFANKVLLVEGPTETSLIGYLLKKNPLNCQSDGIFLLDTLGKYNMHRFMKLLGEFGIPHAVLYDKDNGKNNHLPINSTIENSKNDFTLGIDCFEKDLEQFLAITPTKDRHRKPQHVMMQLHQGNIKKEKQDLLMDKVKALLRIQND